MTSLAKGGLLSERAEAVDFNDILSKYMLGTSGTRKATIVDNDKVAGLLFVRGDLKKLQAIYSPHMVIDGNNDSFFLGSRSNAAANPVFKTVPVKVSHRFRADRFEVVVFRLA